MSQIVDLITEGVGGSDDPLQYINEGMGFAAAAAFARTIMSEGLAFTGDSGCLMREGMSPYVGVPEPPVTGKLYEDIGTLSYTGFSLLLADPASRIGDIMVTDAFDNNGNAVVVNPDGTGYIDAHGSLEEQQFQTQVFHVLGLAYGSLSTIFINDNPPLLVNPIGPITVLLGQPISIDFLAGGNVVDPDGGVITVTLLSGSPPPGVSFTGTGLSGFTTTIFSGSMTFRFSDPAGESITVVVPIRVLGSVTVPNVIGLDFATEVVALTALGLTVRTNAGGYDPVIAAGDVLTQSIAGGTLVAQGTTIFLSESLGPQPATVPGFRVTAVTAGYYNGESYLAGDVFDILFDQDYSDSTVNYDTTGETQLFGWMLQVPSTTPLQQQQQSLKQPGATSPLRRTVF